MVRTTYHAKEFGQTIHAMHRLLELRGRAADPGNCGIDVACLRGLTKTVCQSIREVDASTSRTAASDELRGIKSGGGSIAQSQKAGGAGDDVLARLGAVLDGEGAVDFGESSDSDHEAPEVGGGDGWDRREAEGRGLRDANDNRPSIHKPRL